MGLEADGSRRDGRPSAGPRRDPLPERVEPQLATLVDRAPEGDGWLHELKLDGYRVIARCGSDGARLYTRSGHDWTSRFAGLARALESLPARAFCADGEVVVRDARGRSDFQALQKRMRGDPGALELFLFDLLEIDGSDLRRAPLLDRKRRLEQLLRGHDEDAPLRYGDHVVGQGASFFERACRSGAEGIVSKRVDAPYRPGRSRTWLKVKCTRRQELVVVGFTDPEGSRVALGALLLGVHDAAGTLRYAGKVGTGFDTRTLRELGERLRGLERRTPALEGVPRGRGVHWVEPELVAEVSFSEWTRDGRVRHPSFVGLREDKPAAEVGLEREAVTEQVADPSPAPPLRAEVAGVRLSTPDRVYFHDVGITKSELAQYWEEVAERALPLLAERPLSLVRCPESVEAECFYQKRADRSVPRSVPRVVVRKGRAPYAMVRDLPSLISLVQVGTLELHVWGARADRLDRPDQIVLDLDPDPALRWERVSEAARLLRGLLDALGLVPFLRWTGGKGLHLVVPLERRSSWAEVKGFARAVAQELVRAAPDRFTATLSRSKRSGKILIDYFRNDPEATTIACWSPRARAGAPIALPLDWDDLDSAARPQVSLRDAPAWLARPDPWRDVDRARRVLTRQMRRRVGTL